MSFLDLTTVAEGAGRTLAVRPVGLVLASTDPVALDALAASAIGYDGIPAWTTYYGGTSGLGCSDLARIDVRGVDWRGYRKSSLEPPAPVRTGGLPPIGRITNFLNNTIFRPRPVIAHSRCNGCGECADRCPVSAIVTDGAGAFHINRSQCSDCGNCLHCPQHAITLQFVGTAKLLRTITSSLPSVIDPKQSHPLDPVPKN